jgi:hypothetical protein
VVRQRGTAAGVLSSPHGPRDRPGSELDRRGDDALILGLIARDSVGMTPEVVCEIAAALIRRDRVDPKSGAEISIPETHHPSFRPSKGMQDRLNGTEQGYLGSRGDAKAEAVAIEAYLGDSL